MFKYLRIASIYPIALEAYYKHHPKISRESYATQYRHLMDQYLGLSDSYEKELSSLGVLPHVILVNAEPLQKTWAKENHINYQSPRQVVFQQILRFQPEVLWLNDTSLCDEHWLGELRNKVESLRLIIGNCCSPYNSFTLNLYKKCNFVLCCCQQLADELSQKGVSTHVVMHGFDETILSKVPQSNHSIKVLFTGSILAGDGFHQRRHELIENLLQKDIDLTIYGAVKKEHYLLVRFKQILYKSFKWLEKKDKAHLLRNTWLHRRILSKNYPGYMSISHNMKKKIFPPKFGIEMFHLLQEADICLNIHGDIANKDAANMRLFEATGMGSCLVTDWKANMCALFDDGSEVITYKDPQDCAEKIKWLLQHPEHRKRIAQAGQKKCLSQHSVKQRAKQLYDLIIQELYKQ